MKIKRKLNGLKSVLKKTKLGHYLKIKNKKGKILKEGYLSDESLLILRAKLDALNKLKKTIK